MRNRLQKTNGLIQLRRNNSAFFTPTFLGITEHLYSSSSMNKKLVWLWHTFSILRDVTILSKNYGTIKKEHRINSQIFKNIKKIISIFMRNLFSEKYVYKHLTKSKIQKMKRASEKAGNDFHWEKLVKMSLPGTDHCKALRSQWSFPISQFSSSNLSNHQLLLKLLFIYSNILQGWELRSSPLFLSLKRLSVYNPTSFLRSNDLLLEFKKSEWLCRSAE